MHCLIHPSHSMKQPLHSLFACCLFLFSWAVPAGSVCAQGVGDILSATPASGPGGSTPSSIEVVAGIPISLSTGTAYPSLPLYTLPGRRLSQPIGLTYNGQGVQVTGVASEVGTGWELQAGGKITCEVKGQPDESRTDNLNWIAQMYADHSYRDIMRDKLCNGGNDYPDTEHDVYHVSVQSLSFSFVIDRTTSPVTAYALDNRLVRVEPTVALFSSSRPVTDIKVTDENGTQYYFYQSNRTYVSAQTRNLNTNALSPVRAYDYTGSWNLSRIETADGDKAYFYYTPEPSTTTQYISYSERRLLTQCQGNDGTANCSNWTGPNPVWRTTTTVTEQNPYKLSEIVTDAGSVHFYRSASTRLDLPGSHWLSRMTAMDKAGNMVKSINFNYSYFRNFNTTTTDPNLLRLRLDAVVQSGTGCTTAKTSFGYIERGSVDRLGVNRDYWGYFNANASTSLLPSVSGYSVPSGDRAANGFMMQNCLLNQITNEGGGTVTLAYEAHETVNGVTIGGNRIKSITLNDGVRTSSDVYTFDYYQFDSTNPSSRAYPRTGYGEIPILYDRQVLQWDYDDVCTNRDDNVWTYLYRSSEPLYGQFSENIRYSNIIINYPNNAKKVYKMTSQADFGDMPDGESLKLTTNPYDEGSSCYNDYLLPDKRAFWTNCSDPRSPRYRGDITNLPMNERPFGIVQSGASYRGLITTIYEVNATNNIVGGVSYNYDYTVNNTFCPLRSAVVAREHELAGHGVYSFYYNVKFYKYRLVWVPLLSQTAFRYDQRPGNSATITSQSVTTQYEYSNNQLSKVYKTGDTGGSNISVTEFQRVTDVATPPGGVDR